MTLLQDNIKREWLECISQSGIEFTLELNPEKKVEYELFVLKHSIRNRTTVNFIIPRIDICVAELAKKYFYFFLSYMKFLNRILLCTPFLLYRRCISVSPNIFFLLISHFFVNSAAQKITILSEFD